MKNEKAIQTASVIFCIIGRVKDHSRKTCETANIALTSSTPLFIMVLDRGVGLMSDTVN